MRIKPVHLNPTSAFHPFGHNGKAISGMSLAGSHRRYLRRVARRANFSARISARIRRLACATREGCSPEPLRETLTVARFPPRTCRNQPFHLQAIQCQQRRVRQGHPSKSDLCAWKTGQSCARVVARPQLARGSAKYWASARGRRRTSMIMQRRLEQCEPRFFPDCPLKGHQWGTCIEGCRR